MQFKEEEQRVFQTEPDFSFCWALAWRLLLLSTAISFVPLIFFNLLVSTVISLTVGYSWILVLLGNTLIVLGALSLALKVFLSKSFNGSSVRFYTVQPPNQFSTTPPRSSTFTTKPFVLNALNNKQAE